MVKPFYCTHPAAALIAGLMSFPVYAQSSQTPPELADLVGARAAGGEAQMQSRGWTNVRASQANGASWTFWWNGRTCVSIATRDGRYASISRVPDGNCSQQGGPRPPVDNRPPQGGRPDYGPPPARPDYGPGPSGGYGDDGDDSLTLICFGGGTKLATDYRSGYRYCPPSAPMAQI